MQMIHARRTLSLFLLLSCLSFSQYASSSIFSWVENFKNIDNKNTSQKAKRKEERLKADVKSDDNDIESEKEDGLKELHETTKKFEQFADNCKKGGTCDQSAILKCIKAFESTLNNIKKINGQSIERLKESEQISQEIAKFDTRCELKKYIEELKDCDLNSRESDGLEKIEKGMRTADLKTLEQNLQKLIELKQSFEVADDVTQDVVFADQEKDSTQEEQPENESEDN